MRAKRWGGNENGGGGNQGPVPKCAAAQSRQCGPIGHAGAELAAEHPLHSARQMMVETGNEE